MSFFDVAGMALHNLWSRKLRTLLNILGVVLACVVLSMMLAGTRGVSRGFDRMINQSEYARRFSIYRRWDRSIPVPREVTEISTEMDPARRKRLQKRLESEWRRKNSTRVPLGESQVDLLRQLPHMRELQPAAQLQCSLKLREQLNDATVRVTGRDSISRSRLLFGSYLAEDDQHGIMLGEYAAFRLGYASDEELRALLGQRLDVAVRLRQPQSRVPALFPGGLASLAAGIPPGRLRRLMRAIDLEALEAGDRKLIEPLINTAMGSDESGSKRQESAEDDADESPEFNTAEYTIRGIVRDAEEGEGFSLFDFVGTASGADVYMTADRAAELEMQKPDFTTFYNAVGVVDEIGNLRELTEAVEELGFGTRSSLRLFERIDEEIGKARLVIGALSVLILLISAIGISNTMIVSVLERTREFGILKAVGAQDRNIFQLMVFEGALTGLVGAIVAILISLGLARLVAIFVRRYVAGRIGEQFDASVFAFTPSDLAIVVAMAVLVCTVAAIAPAMRAARLDPVVAMRGR